jgi:DNA polymerase-3 subunit gamma/tau
LDAASNNSVDDIRNLIDQIRIPPQVGNYKVYIIDEVHMLSAQAFNAFLKTLEEPPNHVIFILATTEKHKIIPTILSRCQIFDFRRITVTDIKNHLAKVAQLEGVSAEDDALHIIAQKADGALRDALSIFDRVVSFSGKNLTREMVTENLNVLDYVYYFKITDILLENNIPEVLLLFNEILAKGFDGHHFIMGLATHFRDLLVCKEPVTIDLLEVGEQIKKMYLEQSEKCDHNFLIDGITLANDADLKFKTSRNQRLLIELCLMQLASLTQKDIQAEKKKSSLAIDKITDSFILPPPHAAQKPNIAKDQGDTLNNNKDNVGKSENDSQALDTVDPKKTIPYETKVIERPMKVAERNAKRISALSLKSIKKKQQLEKELVANKPVEKELPKNKFTKEEMVSAWNNYSTKIEKQGKFNLHSHLSMGLPKLEGSTIHLEFPNHTIKVEVERAKTSLLNHLRKSLNNYEIDIEIDVNETEVKRYAYTPREKFDKLNEINPNLDQLRKEFDLDV